MSPQTILVGRYFIDPQGQVQESFFWIFRHACSAAEEASYVAGMQTAALTNDAKLFGKI